MTFQPDELQALKALTLTLDENDRIRRLKPANASLADVLWLELRVRNAHNTAALLFARHGAMGDRPIRTEDTEAGNLRDRLRVLERELGEKEAMLAWAERRIEQLESALAGFMYADK